jgi:phage terminase small subunit
VCHTWAKLQEAVAKIGTSEGEDHKASIAFVCLNKAFTQQAKAFGMTPESRKKLDVHEEEEKDEFNL